MPRRWYDSTGCALDPAPSFDTDQALSSTPVSKLSNIGPYSPYLGQISPICRDPPPGFKVDQVQIYSRHGARNPTANSLKSILKTLDKVVNRTSTDESLKFVQNFTYGDVKAEQLTDFGRRELWIAGKTFKEAYPDLIGDRFTRAGSDNRVVESGQFFLQGLEGETYSLTANKSAIDVVSPSCRWDKKSTVTNGRSSQRPMARTTPCQSVLVQRMRIFQRHTAISQRATGSRYSLNPSPHESIMLLFQPLTYPAQTLRTSCLYARLTV